jgi:hypothetical protein
MLVRIEPLKSFIAARSLVSSIGTTTILTRREGRDLDGNASTFEAYYDTAQNITWLSDAAYTWEAGLSVKQSYRLGAQTTGWSIESTFNAVDVYGVSGWRLPKLLDQSCIASGLSSGCGGADASELSHLWRVTLGNPNENLDAGVQNLGPFKGIFDNVAATGFHVPEFWLAGWTGSVTQASANGYSQSFTLHPLELLGGAQSIRGSADYVFGRLWLVHDGDVAAVPEPSSWMFMGLGLMGVASLMRRRR